MKKFTNLITALVLKSGINITTPSFAVKHGVMVGNLFFNPLKISVNVGIEDHVLSNSQIYPNQPKGFSNSGVVL